MDRPISWSSTEPDLVPTPEPPPVSELEFSSVIDDGAITNSPAQALALSREIQSPDSPRSVHFLNAASLPSVSSAYDQPAVPPIRKDNIQDQRSSPNQINSMDTEITITSNLDCSKEVGSEKIFAEALEHVPSEPSSISDHAIGDNIERLRTVQGGLRRSH